MLKVDFLNFKKILNRAKKDEFAEFPIYFKENDNDFTLYFSEGVFQFKTIVPKDQFTDEFKVNYLKDAIKLEEEIKPTFSIRQD